MSFQIINISQLFNNGRSGKLINKINDEDVSEDHRLILVDSNMFQEKRPSLEGFDVGNMIYDMLSLTRCPVLIWPKNISIKQIKNILHPVDVSMNVFSGYDRILPLVKLCNAQVHLLVTNNPAGNEPIRLYEEILSQSNSIFRKYNIQVKQKLIVHSKESDTILAYASIICADLIVNGIEFKGSSLMDCSFSTWLDLINRSYTPLYNIGL